MRKIMLLLHRWLGIVFGVFISIICLTGAMIVFQDEIKT
ncbi:MAG: PepSY domain-containing protein, partial [Paludibacteraceae bacterium]|nr:PepSY domain-containing protein [Paludibacteraceae bacterium]